MKEHQVEKTVVPTSLRCDAEGAPIERDVARHRKGRGARPAIGEDLDLRVAIAPPPREAIGEDSELTEPRLA